MNLQEIARLMTELRRMGLTDTQIVDLVLYIESGAEVQSEKKEKKAER